MTIWLFYLLLGVIQGFTEPIPISSSGHLVIFQELFNIQLPGLSFEIFVNFASLLAVLTIYRKDVVRLVVSLWTFLFKKDRSDDTMVDVKFIGLLLVATVPAGVLGVVFGDWIGETLSGVSTVGYTLIITGLALWFIRNMRGSKGDGGITLRDAILIGLAQAAALIPGISRSGATIVMALLLGIKQETALRFSFFMFIPVSLGTILLDGPALFTNPETRELFGPLIVAFIASYILTAVSLKWFQHIMAKGELKYFSFYCWTVGILVVLFLA
ncbi:MULTISPECIES: undecaprenyl-diphosphate phosphatase [Exiguobacterium]|uniref:undecaprenyl-diphosphate phosphatase n=1 Tax=Exiguobacterium TaxID=33986 RepID=UPI001BE86E2E|nr:MULTISPECIES: undecaprenyl-diphosphate phosphatase [Exiguobacterium]MCT4783059.1 undecaprenyl-diphosphate phosphatase [Exiguobacterium himgiriensis]